jgi:hypothetical protein
MDLPVIV